ncbi:MAG TPA: hypothetical protein VFX20_18210 [Steroidobacteraceae bacterium]|nr:hypothetical protein [Steroidobacteraceae bacterium]
MRHTRSLFIASLALACAALAAPAFAAAPVCTQGKAGVAPIATLTFTAPTTNTDGTPIATPLSYTVFQGTATGAETKVASALAGSPIVLTVGLSDATTYFWYLTVTDANGNSSVPSNEVCKTFPGGVPGTITITLQ